MKMNPSIFTGVKVEEDPQGFLDKIEKIFQVIWVTNMKSVNFAAYQLKDITSQWYEEQNKDMGDIEEEKLWEAFSNAFLDCFSTQELRDSKMEEFMNLKQGKISVKDYTLKFNQLARYAPEMVGNMRA